MLYTFLNLKFSLFSGQTRQPSIVARSFFRKGYGIVYSLKLLLKYCRNGFIQYCIQIRPFQQNKNELRKQRYKCWHYLHDRINLLEFSSAAISVFQCYCKRLCNTSIYCYGTLSNYFLHTASNNWNIIEQRTMLQLNLF